MKLTRGGGESLRKAIDDQLVYSRYETGRFPAEAELENIQFQRDLLRAFAAWPCPRPLPDWRLSFTFSDQARRRDAAATFTNIDIARGQAPPGVQACRMLKIGKFASAPGYSPQPLMIRGSSIWWRGQMDFGFW